MKQLLTFLSTITLISATVLNTTFFTKFSQKENNNNSPHLSLYPTVNLTETNEFGTHVQGVPAEHKNNFYVRFSMTSAIYNMLNLVAQYAQREANPGVAFSEFFLKEQDEYPQWAYAIKQYNDIMHKYENIYKVNLDQVFKSWLSAQFSYFYNIFTAESLATNILNYNNQIPQFNSMSSTEQTSELVKMWRRTGVVLTIPFHYNNVNQRWSIPENNIRMFPQVPNILPLTYYYNGGSTYSTREAPLMYIPVAHDVTAWNLDGTKHFPAIQEAFLNSINCPPTLMRFYRVTVRGGIIPAVNTGHPLGITFTFGSGGDYSLTKIKKIVYFYLQPAPE